MFFLNRIFSRSLQPPRQIAGAATRAPHWRWAGSGSSDFQQISSWISVDFYGENGEIPGKSLENPWKTGGNLWTCWHVIHKWIQMDTNGYKCLIDGKLMVMIDRETWRFSHDLAAIRQKQEWAMPKPSKLWHGLPYDKQSSKHFEEQQNYPSRALPFILGGWWRFCIALSWTKRNNRKRGIHGKLCQFCSFLGY